MSYKDDDCWNNNLSSKMMMGKEITELKKRIKELEKIIKEYKRI